VNHERFVQILDAYGACPAHWPDGERAAAALLLAAPDTIGMTAQEMLLRAAALDAELDSYTLALPDEDFLRQIESSAVVPVVVPIPPPQVPPRPQRSRGLHIDWLTPRHWFSGGRLIGVGLLSAGVIGLATGLATISLLAPAGMGASVTTTTDEPVYGGTVFGSTSSDWSDQ